MSLLVPNGTVWTLCHGGTHHPCVAPSGVRGRGSAWARLAAMRGADDTILPITG